MYFSLKSKTIDTVEHCVYYFNNDLSIHQSLSIPMRTVLISPAEATFDDCVDIGYKWTHFMRV
jgi:hypothetical protein